MAILFSSTLFFGSDEEFIALVIALQTGMTTIQKYRTDIEKTSRFLLVLLGVCTLSNSAEADSCVVSYGDIVDVQSCKTATLPDFKVRFIGTAQPFPIQAMSCWNYEVYSDSDRNTFRQCHTGELGGDTKFALNGSQWKVEFDVKTPGSDRSVIDKGFRFTRLP